MAGDRLDVNSTTEPFDEVGSGTFLANGVDGSQPPLSLGQAAVAGQRHGERTELSRYYPVNGRCASTTGYHPAGEQGTRGAQHGQPPLLEVNEDRFGSFGSILIGWWTAP